MITLSKVSKWYPNFQVLKNCSTHIEKGEVVVVCGPSEVVLGGVIFEQLELKAHRPTNRDHDGDYPCRQYQDGAVERPLPARRAPDRPCTAGALEDDHLCGRAPSQWNASPMHC